MWIWVGTQLGGWAEPGWPLAGWSKAGGILYLPDLRNDKMKLGGC